MFNSILSKLASNFCILFVSFRFILVSKFSNKGMIQIIGEIKFECLELVLAFCKEIYKMFDFDVASPQPYSEIQYEFSKFHRQFHSH